MEKPDVWTEDKCIQLVREFKDKPLLWDPKHPCFFKKTLKPLAWKQIAQSMNIPADVCKRKMVILMSSFRREKCKIMKSLKTTKDASEVYKSSWFAFQEMAFLMDRSAYSKRCRLKEIPGEGDNVEDDVAINVRKNLLKHHIQAPISTINNTQPSRIKKSITYNHNAQAINVDERLNISKPEPGPSQSPEERDEEIKSFINFIGSKMKRYSHITKNAVQQEICDIIFKADRNVYEENCSNTDLIITDIEDNDEDQLNKPLVAAEISIKTEHYSDSE